MLGSESLKSWFSQPFYKLLSYIGYWRTITLILGTEALRILAAYEFTVGEETDPPPSNIDPSPAAQRGKGAKSSSRVIYGYHAPVRTSETRGS